jgi:tryptophan synthase alpha subunit
MAHTENRIDRMFRRLKSEGRKAFATFTLSSDPSFDESLERLRLLVKSGIDLLEIGHPFSDPVLDGATIQAANGRALAAGGNLARTFELCAAFRAEDSVTPIVHWLRLRLPQKTSSRCTKASEVFYIVSRSSARPEALPRPSRPSPNPSPDAGR